jgi:hypothetical protein
VERSEVYGVRETLAALKAAEPKLRLAAMAKMRSAAKPMVDTINAAVPTSPPLSGFDHNGRTGWGKRKKFRAKVGGRARRDRETWPLVEIRNDSGPVQIFDMAANGQLGDALTSRYGPASRAAWRVEADLVEATQRAVLDAIDTASAQVNRDLVMRG